EQPSELGPRTRGHPQVLRAQRGLEGDRPKRRGARGSVPDRGLRLRQVDPAPVHEPGRADRRRKGGGRGGGDHGLRSKRRPCTPAHRHRLPVLQPLPPHDRAPQHHPRPPRGPQDGPEDRGRPRRLPPEPLRAGGQEGRVPGPALGRPAAAGRHRAGTGDAALHHAAGRGDERARPGARRRGPLGHQGARARGHDHAHRDPRDGLRPRHRRPRLLPGGGTHPGAGPAREDLLLAGEPSHGPLPPPHHRGRSPM
ncbi:MAG: ABC transporter, ATP-binding protein (cluster 3, basic aa/glutamine/opines), partial [uncultured Rubrobacteraceae bacterium]